MAEAPLEVVRACRLGLGGIVQFWCRGERLGDSLGALLKSRQGTPLRRGRPGDIHYAVLTGSAGPVDEVLVAWSGWGAEVNCHGGSASALAVLALLREAGFAEISPRAWYERASFAPGRELEEEICPLYEFAVTPLQVRLLSGARAFAREVRVLRDSFLAGGEIAQVQDAVTRWRAFAPFAACGLKRHTVAIAGAPNVGKSTLFNRLLNSDRAMVSDLPGTTRDAVRHPLEVEGLEVELIDTAGILAGARGADEESVRRSREILKGADLRLLLFDGSRPFSGEDREAWALCSGLPLVTGVNKADLTCAWDSAAFEALAGSSAPVFISAQSELSLSPLLSRVGGVLWGGLREEVKAGDTGPLTSRQVECCRHLEDGWKQGSDRVIREAFDQLLRVKTGERDTSQWEERRRR